MSEFCSHCSCPSCSAIQAERLEKEQKKNRLRQEKLSKIAARMIAENTAHFESVREGLMIWLLTSTARNQNEANAILGQIARALELRVGQVNTRRTRIARMLSTRSRVLLGVSEPGRWAALPGSQGTELPEYCPKCSGMKTEGRKCARRKCSKTPV